MIFNHGEEIGEEIHNANDQFFRFENGNAKCIINGTEYQMMNGDAIVIPVGAKHNIINIETAEELKNVHIYASLHHKKGSSGHPRQRPKTFPKEFDGKTTE